MNDLALLLAMGLSGSLHCTGMCGPLALAAPRLPAYLAGKAVTYVFLGTLAGALGRAAGQPRILAVAVGLMLAAMGLDSLGLIRLPQPAAAWLAPVITHMRGNSLLFGAATGLLPCPMVYAFAGVAAATGSPVAGAATMLVLAATTVLPLAACAILGRRLTLRLPYVPGVLLLAMAGVSLYRGLSAAAAHCH